MRWGAHAGLMGAWHELESAAWLALLEQAAGQRAVVVAHVQAVIAVARQAIEEVPLKTRTLAVVQLLNQGLGVESVPDPPAWCRYDP